MRTEELARYKQVKFAIASKIQTGEYVVGQKMPSEPALCEMYSVSRTTVRQAMDDLARDGLICKMQGRGTFVAPLTPSSLVDEHLPPGHVRSFDYISHSASAASARERELLKLTGSVKVVRFRRMRREGGELIALKDYLIPVSVLGGDLPRIDELKEDVIDVILRRRNVAAKSVYLSIKPVNPSEDERHLLGLGPDVLGLRVTERGIDGDGQTIKVVESLIRGDTAGYHLGISMISNLSRSIGRSYSTGFDS